MGLGIVGTIAQDMTIPEDYPIVLVAEQRSGQMTLRLEQRLPLAKETILKVRPDQEGVNTGTEVIVYGTLNSLGTATHPVYITALADDSVGGDTNGDGGASSPSPGRWTYLIASGAAAQLNLVHTTVAYAGQNFTSPRGSVRVHNGAQLSMDQSVVHSNASYSIYATSGSTITISNSSVISGTTHGVRASNSSVTIVTSTISHNSGTGIVVEGNDDNSTAIISNNLIENNGNDGITLLPTARFTPLISNNIISHKAAIPSMSPTRMVPGFQH